MSTTDTTETEFSVDEGERAIEVWRQKKDSMTDAQINMLLNLLQHEKNRRKTRGETGDRPEWPTAGCNNEQHAHD